MPGPSDISAILSQGGRIEKITQSSFVQPDIAKQVLTEEEAKERLRKSREVNESQKGQQIITRDRDRRSARDERKRQQADRDGAAPDESTPDQVRKHLIDVVV
ncbi:MAG: hypothetical protein ACOX3E_07380 [Desulfomonilia bacterium]|jgi:hypothetical protein|uniref:Uncharacterized protein n=1 Tax=anaerobic digester metagenome TaxID=1263854 RepID=A0A485M0T6_9ZZZZ|nr:hypothetical protein [Pseudomonadota bacterium]HPD22595.1 hypothetical protein [Deltaproteobacteria bacterium]HPW69612.1 hypothetical protein [Deltaproteobacteria bacterium]HRS57377.1 hypothetical protein [Desulfomonilia bacterium]HRV36913.1 hypothetical protein [Desulfomonilia bacterium]